MVTDAYDRRCAVSGEKTLPILDALTGKQFDIAATINAVSEAADIQQIVLLAEPRPDVTYSRPAVPLSEWIAPFAAAPIGFFRGGFDAPLAILFSSGTTGKPKCIVHRAGGLLIQHKKEQVLQCDVRAGDRLFYYTTCGWMMWNWLVSGLAAGATIVSYDGSRTYPSLSRLPDLIDAEQISIFGTSAKYIDSCRKSALRRRGTHRLTQLRSILSTGSPLLPESFDYIYDAWKSDVHLASTSGGTDICGCFLGGAPTQPVRRGELQGPISASRPRRRTSLLISVWVRAAWANSSLAATMVGRVLEGIEDTDAPPGKILHVPRDKHEPMNARRGCEREIPPVLVLGPEQARPLRNDGRIDRKDAVGERLLQRVYSGQQNSGTSRITALEGLRTATLFEERRGAQPQVGIIYGG